LVTTSIQGYSLRFSLVPSVDPLSTTTTWSPGRSVGRRESRQGRVWPHAFQAKRTTVARQPARGVLTSNLTAHVTSELIPRVRSGLRSDGKGVAS
jgi:hypothetical protein